jgi:serine/threonine protein kinase
MYCAACGEPTTSDPCGACRGPALLDGRYHLDAIVGTGAMGTTWRATSIIDASSGDGAVVAIKEMPLRRMNSDKAIELVGRESRVLRELQHPAIPMYWEELIVGTGRNRTLYLVQEFIDGRTLADELKEVRYTERQVLDIIAELLGVLRYLHGLRPPVVHRDIKPGNVMRRSDGSLALIDFGAVRDVMKGELGGSTVAGTFGYMAPEQFQGDAWPVTDVYGVGALAVALLTRREPQTMSDWAGKVKWDSFTSASPAVRSLIHDLMRPDPRDRIQTVDAALRRIEQVTSVLERELDWLPEVPRRVSTARVPPMPPMPPLIPERVAEAPMRPTLQVALAKVRETRESSATRVHPIWAKVDVRDTRSDLLDPEYLGFVQRGELVVGRARAWLARNTLSAETVGALSGLVLALVAIVGFAAVCLLPLTVFQPRGGVDVAAASAMVTPVEKTTLIPVIRQPAPPAAHTSGLFATDPGVRQCVATWRRDLVVPEADGTLRVVVDDTTFGPGTVRVGVPDGIPDRDVLQGCLDGAVAEESLRGGLVALGSAVYEVPILDVGTWVVTE